MGLQDRDYMRRPRKNDERPNSLTYMRPLPNGRGDEQ